MRIIDAVNEVMLVARDKRDAGFENYVRESNVFQDIMKILKGVQKDIEEQTGLTLIMVSSDCEDTITLHYQERPSENGDWVYADMNFYKIMGCDRTFHNDVGLWVNVYTDNMQDEQVVLRCAKTLQKLMDALKDAVSKEYVANTYQEEW